MKKTITRKQIILFSALLTVAALSVIGFKTPYLNASSHREAPAIANDPLADNTDLYAFRSPDDTNTVTIIADYIPGELPSGGPNYYSFGGGVRYEIHIKNQIGKDDSKGNDNDGDDSRDNIIYRFEFRKNNEDPTTFFNIRLGKQNLKTTYKCYRSMDGGQTFRLIVDDGVVPPNNIGPRSISSPVGLNEPSYDVLRTNAIATATTGETIFCGPSDDPFFVDLGGIFDLANVRPGQARDALACKNIHSICIKVPIRTLQKDHKTVQEAKNILDPDFVIGVYATASRQRIKVLSETGEGGPENSGKWIQISRLGMPLTNEVLMPIGRKDYWNHLKPYNEDTSLIKYFTNPELALYMDPTQFGNAVPALAALRIQSNSLGAYNFRDYQNGLAGLLGNSATDGTALAENEFGKYLLRPGQPRSVDLLPIFETGVPNLPPYQLATGKGGNPLAAGKPFISNFLPTYGDMLRLNMAVPVTPRNSADFSSEGLVQAAVLGLTDSRFNTSTALQFIPNMDGFPNGRRLEDDVTRIELQAVSGVVLAAVGLWYDDYNGSGSPVTPDLVGVLTFSTGVEANDTPFVSGFPYLAVPHSGFGPCGGTLVTSNTSARMEGSSLGIAAPPAVFMQNYPNPASYQTTFKYRLNDAASVDLKIVDINGKLVASPIKTTVQQGGSYEVNYNVAKLANGTYYAVFYLDGQAAQSISFVVAK